MDISTEERPAAQSTGRGPRARTARLMLASAVRLMQAGAIPSVSQVAEEAQVSRATAYRYFPSQAALVQAVVGEALGPILDWRSDSMDTAARVRDLLETGLPRLDAFEATFRAALKHALDEWARREEGTAAAEPQFRRGHRVELLRDAISPTVGKIPDETSDRLAKALSLVFGIETLVILKDIWGCDAREAQEVAIWAAEALVAAATAGQDPRFRE